MTPWLSEAFEDLDLTEIRGDLHEPRIISMFAVVGHSWVKDDETAWCGAAVGAWLIAAGIHLDQIPKAERLSARGYLKLGRSCPGPLYGAIGVKRRVGGTPSQGHVGLVVAANQATIWMIGGNQSDSVKVAPFKRSEFLGYRWPWPYDAYPMPSSSKDLPTLWKGSAAPSRED